MLGEGVEALGYIGLEVSQIDAWTHFASAILGLQPVPRADGTVDLRMDQYAVRIRLHQGPSDDLAYIGWEVRDASALDRLALRLEGEGLAVERAGPDLLADRRVAGLIRFSDPEGTATEVFYGPLQRTDAPFVSPLGVRFKTGRQGLGHIVLACRDKAALLRFYGDQLGLRLSDHINTEVMPGRPLRISFLRCNGRHHSLALAEAPAKKKIFHLMLEVLDIDDVGRGMYRCLGAGVHLSMTIGRHSNDEMLSFYPLTPSGFDIEYGWGGLEVDDETWHVLVHETTSAWGHHFQRPPKSKSSDAVNA